MKNYFTSSDLVSLQVFSLFEKMRFQATCSKPEGNPRNPTFRRFPFFPIPVFWSRFPYQLSQERMDFDTPSVVTI